MFRSVRSVSRILGAPQVHLFRCLPRVTSPSLDVDRIPILLPMATSAPTSHKGKAYVVQVDLTSTGSSFQAADDGKKRMEQILRNRETQTKVRQVTSPNRNVD
jgi:hypothetical protein